MQEAIGDLKKHFNSAHPINLEIQKTMIQDRQWIRSFSHAPRTRHSTLTDDEVRQYETKRVSWDEVAKLCAKVVRTEWISQSFWRL
ncbi:uncharacterized protein MYCGRDRAFT_106608 [Zymoseptoria tritici IPO323]|uniref:Uncharacterized protein n=1 Tax=Zymoseptoria tritici (strain CBS 115943 / IPO323) TaxID=336722 RepID=F9XQV3_ZYMTI|nr:uncharacterized protein MYCGRDRAFT_106608 [Zymoseptoria tritici IPO323]EGP82355.1 hypothetical protein MYCGRDRAFT_106608 [Zymoseptoria tritici IPO323]